MPFSGLLIDSVASFFILYHFFLISFRTFSCGRSNRQTTTTTSHFGFRTDSFTDLAITSFYDKLLNNSDENKMTFSLFLDLKKKFDAVDHQLLLKKLYHYGFRGPVFNLLQSYLNERKIYAKIKEKISKSYNVTMESLKDQSWGRCFFFVIR